MQYYTILYNTLQYNTIQYNTIQYYTILYYTILYYTILCCTTLYFNDHKDTKGTMTTTHSPDTRITETTRRTRKGCAASARK